MHNIRNIVLIIGIFLTGTGQLVKTTRIDENGKETITWTNKSNAERIEREKGARQETAEYYSRLPRRAVGETIFLSFNKITIDPQLKIFNQKVFMGYVLERFRSNPIYNINSNHQKSDFDIYTHVELGKDVGISREGNLGEMHTMTITGVITSRFSPDKRYHIDATSNVFRYRDAIDEYYRKINGLIMGIAPVLPNRAYVTKDRMNSANEILNLFQKMKKKD